MTLFFHISNQGIRPLCKENVGSEAIKFVTRTWAKKSHGCGINKIS